MKTSLLACLVLAACAGDGSGPQPSMPDGSTQSGDDASNPPPDGPSNVCSPSDPNSCSGETICIASHCEAAYGRIYKFGDISATIAAQNTGGSAWDAFGGAPDPKVTVKLQGQTILTTSVKSDTFTAQFTESTERELIAGQKLEVSLVDADVNSDDGVLNCVADPLEAAFLRAGGIMCAGTGTSTGSSVTVHITPK